MFAERFSYYLAPNERNGFKAKVLHPSFLCLIASLIFFVNTALPGFFIKADTNDITVESLLDRHNQERQKHGLKSLKLSRLLSNSATKKAEQMLSSNCWSHYCPNGKSPWDFILESGYDYLYAGENLAEGFTSVDRLMLRWMNSKKHRENILKSEFEEIGFGLASGNFQGKENNLLVVVHFGTLPIQMELTNAYIDVIKPKDGQVFFDSEIELYGHATNLENVSLHLNYKQIGTIPVNEGIFTTKLNGLVPGENQIVVKSDDLNVSDSVFIRYLPDGVQFASLAVTSSSIVNLFFLTFVLAVLAVDLYYVLSTKVVSKRNNFNHYHFSLIFVLFFIALTSDVASNIS